MSDYSFMKTGFDLTGDNELEDNKNIVALVTLFGENATKKGIFVKISQLLVKKYRI